MIEAELGSIVNIGSSSYMMQEDFFPGYAIAKSGVEGITAHDGPHVRSAQRAGQHRAARMGADRATAREVVVAGGRSRAR